MPRANSNTPTYRGAKQIAIGYLYTSLFCIAIALMLWLVGVTSGLAESLQVSFAIGLSVNTAFVLLEPWLLLWLSPYVAPAVVSVIGLLCGLAIGGYAVSGRPGLFFFENQSSLILGAFFGITGYLLFGSRARVMELDAQLSATRAEQAIGAQKMAETELRLLQAQIEPHFLFNTLSNVSSLIRSNPAGAEQMLNNLSTLLRHSLRRTRSTITTLGDEVAMLLAYLEIQKIRMGERLEFKLDIPQELHQLPLPPMLLQPLVENSVRHGLEPAETGGALTLTASQDNDMLIFLLEDTGVGISSGVTGSTPDTSSDSGTGLQNVRERLRVLYGGKAIIEITESQPHGVRVKLCIPMDADP